MMNEDASGDVRITQSKPAQATGFDMEVLIGYILLIGVLLSIFLLLVGTAWQWISTGSPRFDYTLQAMNFWAFLFTSLRRLWAGDLRPQTVIDLGISALLLTPYVRVFASMLYFLAKRNWKYSVFTLFVFSVLSYSLFLR
jgi:uncharacterized membrane protein